MIRPDDITADEYLKDRIAEAKAEYAIAAVREILAAKSKMEPAAVAVEHEIAWASIAISLKRIADALESPAFADKIEQAISTGIWQGTQNAIGEWRRSR